MTAPYDGKRFSNLGSVVHCGFWGFVRWRVTRKRGTWRRIEAPPGARPPEQVTDGIRVTHIGHATMLVQLDGVNILTDPIWSERASPVSWAGPRRYRPPGLAFEDLPRIDVVLLSHDHYDHLDLPTLRRLHVEHGPAIYTGLHNGDRLLRNGIGPVHELDWWEEAAVAPGMEVHGVPAQHFSGRTLLDRDRTLWLGFVVRGQAGSVYFAGDTGFGDHFAAIAERHGPIDVAILPIGAYLPRWFMRRAHVDPDEAVRAHDLLGARHSFAMHYGTFELADEGQEQPAEELARAIEALPPDRRTFEALPFGEGRTVARGRLAAARAADE